jgi:hypothetical protein
MRYLVYFILLSILSSCGTAEYGSGWISDFKKGQKIEELRHVDKNSTDLREFALSLPILEGRTTDNIDWFYRMSDPASTEQEWELPADGAQSPATLIRLPNHKDGSQQIELNVFPLESTEYDHYKLKRIDKGWIILRADTKKKNE